MWIITKSNRKACNDSSKNPVLTSILCDQCGHPLFIIENLEYICSYCGIVKPIFKVEDQPRKN